ncbi:MAG: hypothetical protein WBW28_09660 [Pseudolabrys sp.]
MATDAAWPTTTKAADCEAHVTIEEYMRLAHAALDEAYTDALRRGIATLSEHGEPTEEELQAFTTWYQQMLEVDRTANLAKIRSFLERDGKALQ